MCGMDGTRSKPKSSLADSESSKTPLSVAFRVLLPARDTTTFPPPLWVAVMVWLIVNRAQTPQGRVEFGTGLSQNQNGPQASSRATRALVVTNGPRETEEKWYQPLQRAQCENPTE